MALHKVKGNFEHMFDKNLTDLVRGIRNYKDHEANFIAQCLDEIKLELTQGNIVVKTNAVSKLIYLQMLGYDISWAAFNIIEVMSSSKFNYKRIGYLAASQSFHDDSELLMLTTNMIRKDLNSQNQYESGVALAGLSCFIDPGLSRDLANDIMSLINTTKPYIRKRAVLIMYKVFLKYPASFRPAFVRLMDKLEDKDAFVQSAAVNVACELASKYPKYVLSLSPVLFNIMKTSTNNWILMKIIRLFGVLAPLDQRFGNGLLEMLTSMIHTTCATSILYECISTVITILTASAMPPTVLNHSAAIQMCIQKLITLVEDSDQNLKYLGLTAMSKIMKSHPKSVQIHKGLVIQCLDDKDESIRLRALDLLLGMVSRKTLPDIVQKLMVHVRMFEGITYRSELVYKIIHLCLQKNYKFITNFEWYVEVLVDLSRADIGHHGTLIASQLLDVATRVKSVRKFLVQQMSKVLAFPNTTLPEVLGIAAWICGEYCKYLNDPEDTLKSMLSDKMFTLSEQIQAIYIHNMLKLMANITNSALERDDSKKIKHIFHMVTQVLTKLMVNDHFEVQERACSGFQLIKCIENKVNIGDMELIPALLSLFVGDLSLVTAEPQQKVTVPPGLDLDAPINQPPPEAPEEGNYFAETCRKTVELDIFKSLKSKEPTRKEIRRSRNVRLVEQSKNPNYLKSTRTRKKKKKSEACKVPIREVDLTIPLQVMDNVYSQDSYQTNEIKNEAVKRPKEGGRKLTVTHAVAEEDLRRRDVLSTDSVNSRNVKMAKTVQLHPRHFECQKRNNSLDEDPDASLREDEYLSPLKHHRAKSSQSLGKNVKKNAKKRNNSKRKNHQKKEDNSKKEEASVNKIDDIKESSLVTIAGYGSEEEEAVTKDEGEDVRSNVASYDEIQCEKGNDDLNMFHGDGITNLDSIELVNDSEHSNDMDHPSHSLLAEDKTLKMMYEQKILQEESNTLLVIMVFVNKGNFLVKQLDFTVSETPMMKLHRDHHERDSYGIKLHFQLPPKRYKEAKFKFEFTDCSAPKKLRGTLTYMVLTSYDISTHEKLDFWLMFPCSSFMVGTLNENCFEKWPIGQVFQRSCLCLSGDLRHITSVITSLCPFIHVRRTGNAVSLQSSSVDGYQVYLQIMDRCTTEGKITIEGKSNSELLLINLLDEIDTLLKCTLSY